MIERWEARRSAVALMAPVLFILAGMVLPFVWDSLFPNLSWTWFGQEQHLDAEMVNWSAGLLIFVGLVIELRIQKQMRLIHKAYRITGIVEIVRRNAIRRNIGTAKYRFRTHAGDWMNGESTISSIAVSALDRGSLVEVFYDPANPKNNAMGDSLWALVWREAEFADPDVNISPKVWYDELGTAHKGIDKPSSGVIANMR